MVTLQDLKDKIEQVEEQIKDKGFSLNEVSINIDYMTEVKKLELDFFSDEYYGVFVRINLD